MTKAHEVILERGVLSFDGRVIEAFGFSFDRPIRAHVTMLKNIDVDEGGRFSDPSVTFNVNGQPIGPTASLSSEEKDSPELAALIDAVRAAAPNLEEGR